MKRSSRSARNVAIFGVFAVLSGVAGTGSWLSATHPATLPIHSAGVPALSGGFEIIGTPPRPVEVKYLDARESTEAEVTLSTPEGPAGLADAAKAWAATQVEEFDGEGTLEVSFEPVFAAGQYLGVELRSAVTGDGARTVAEQVLVTEVGGEGAWPIQDLVGEDAVGEWASYVRRAVKAGALDIAHPSTLEAVEMVEEGLHRARFSEDGFRFPLPGTDTSLLIRDPSGVTALGKEVAKSAEERERFVGLPAPQLPAPKAREALRFPGEDEVDCAREKCIALTFDDGPEQGTGRLLDILAEKKVRSTFFLVGRQVSAHAGIVERMVSEGHIVGNHTWTHLELPHYRRGEVRAQIERAAEAITAAGAPAPTLFRPPYGALSDMVRREISGLGYATILWDVDTLDWESRDTKQTVANALAEARPGGIILMHDIHEETIDAVPRIIKQLRKDGFTLVTVPELLGGEVKVGGVYRNNR